jgi:hypothetical protein
MVLTEGAMAVASTAVAANATAATKNAGNNKTIQFKSGAFAPLFVLPQMDYLIQRIVHP